MAETQALNIEDVQGKKQKDPVVRVMIKVFWILLIVTIIEVGLALLHFEFDFMSRDVLNYVFIILTFVKAFYIIAEFMHMRHELKQLILIIGIPLIFLMWGVSATIWEGSKTNKSRADHRNIIGPTEQWEKVTEQND